MYRLGNVRWIVSYIIEVCFSQVTKAIVSSVKNEWASIASNSKEIHALKAEIKEEMKREVLDSKSKIVEELKGSLLPAIKNIYDEAKEEMKRDSDLCRNQILADLKESVSPVIKTIKEELKGEMKREMGCLLYTSPSPRDKRQSRMPSSA